MKTKNYRQAQFFENNNVFEKPHYFVIMISNLFVILCTIVAISMIAFQFIFDSAPVIGQSMYPTFNATGADLDRVYINNYAKVTYGDVVVLSIQEWGSHESKNIIKRVIGLEGDSIGFVYDKQQDVYYVTRNGEKIEEPYLLNYAGNAKKYQEFLLMGENNENFDPDTQVYTVPKGEIFVLGDNRSNSIDSGVRGSFSMEEIWGRVDYCTPKGLNFFVFFFEQFFSCGMIQYQLS